MTQIKRDRFGATGKIKDGEVQIFPGAKADQERAELSARVMSADNLNEWTVKEVIGFMDQGIIPRDVAEAKERAGEGA